jgi:hypothetical protein
MWLAFSVAEIFLSQLFPSNGSRYSNEVDNSQTIISADTAAENTKLAKIVQSSAPILPVRCHLVQKRMPTNNGHKTSDTIAGMVTCEALLSPGVFSN